MIAAYHFLFEFSWEGLQSEGFRILQLVGIVEFEKSLADIGQESEGQARLSLLACHAQHC